MKTSRLSLFATLVLTLGLIQPWSTTAASEQPDHFKGKPSASLAEAMSNLDEYNAKLAGLLQRDNLTLEELSTVHELTYTLEQALQRIQTDVERMAQDLEAVHKASERADGKTVKTSGAAYLKAAQTLVHR